MSRKYLITENEFESIRVEGRDLVATRDNGTPVNFGQVVPDISPEMQQLLDDTVTARDQAEMFAGIAGDVTDTGMSAVLANKESDTVGVLDSRYSARTVGVEVLPVDGLVAFWDFQEASAPYLSKAGSGGDLPLQIGAGSFTRSADLGPFGPMLHFDGASFLRIPADDVGDLNVSQFGDEVTVIAWCKPEKRSANFMAGMWQEDNNDPRRQYGLFMSNSGRGEQATVAHVASTGSPSYGEPYSYDLACTPMRFTQDELYMSAMTYDGKQATAFLDGISGEWFDYEEAPPPTSRGITYDVNPFYYPLGLNRRSVSEFTVGAVKLTSTYGNWLLGDLGGVAVYRRALSKAEIMQIRKRTCGDAPPINFSFVRRFGHDGGTHAIPWWYGWRAFRSEDCEETTHTGPETENFTIYGLTWGQDPTYQGLMMRNGNNGLNRTPGLATFTGVEGLHTSDIHHLSMRLNNSGTNVGTQFALQVHGEWIVSDQIFKATQPGINAVDWSNQTVVEMPFSREPGTWRKLTVKPGETLAVGSVISDRLRPGDVTGIGVYSAGSTEADRESLRIRDIAVHMHDPDTYIPN